MRLSRLLLVSTLAAASTQAKPWNGIVPGASTADEVMVKFGPPSKSIVARGQRTLIYSGASAIQGTKQAQFKVGADELVERIDVYPAITLRAPAIEASYGPRCGEGAPEEPCYAPKATPQGHRYFVYAKLGLAVFFEDDGQTVRSLTFLPGT